MAFITSEEFFLGVYQMCIWEELSFLTFFHTCAQIFMHYDNFLISSNKLWPLTSLNCIAQGPSAALLTCKIPRQPLSQGHRILCCPLRPALCLAWCLVRHKQPVFAQ